MFDVFNGGDFCRHQSKKIQIKKVTSEKFGSCWYPINKDTEKTLYENIKFWEEDIEIESFSYLMGEIYQQNKIF